MSQLYLPHPVSKLHVSPFENLLPLSLRYLPFNRCIYCDNPLGLPLSDEHIVAESLGGRTVLPKSSCSKCAGVTSYLEGHCTRSIFYDVRLARRMVRKRRDHRHPTHRPVIVDGPSGTTTIEVPITDAPYFLELPVLEPPTIFTRAAPDPKARPTEFVTSQYWFQGDLKKHIKVGQPRNFALPFIMKMAVFARMLAKIGHAMAIARWGFGNWEYLLPNLIQGKEECWWHYVGGTLLGNNPRNLPAWPHQTHFVTLQLYKSYHGHALLVALIRLFCDVEGYDGIGTPAYCVVVGRAEAGRPSNAKGRGRFPPMLRLWS